MDRMVAVSPCKPSWFARVTRGVCRTR